MAYYLAHADAEHGLAEARSQATERDQRLQRRTAALTAAETRISEQDAAMKLKDERLAALQARFDALMEDFAARQDDEADTAGRDARLRSAIVAAGDDTLRLLATERDVEAHTEAAVKAPT